MMVADSGPIIAFAQIGLVHLLQRVVEELVVPDAVYREIVVLGEGRPGAAEVAQSAWITRRTVGNPAALATLPLALRAGQGEAILLAQELGLPLLIDEERGRREATRRGIDVGGSLGVLREAKQRGLIDLVRPPVEAMISSGYRFGPTLVFSFIQEMGEADT